MRPSAASFISFGLALAVTARVRADGIDPTQVLVAGVQYSGTGCGPSSVSFNLSPDLSVLNLYYDDLEVYLGPGTQVTDRTKTCAAHVTLSYPAGYQSGVLGTTYHGSASLSDDTTLTLQTTYYFSSSNLTTTDRVSITGGGDDAAFTKTATEVDLIESPCGTTSSILSVNLRASLTATDSVSTGQVPPEDAQDGTFVQQVQLGWQTCS